MFGKFEKSTKPSEQTPLSGVERPKMRTSSHLGEDLAHDVSSQSAKSDVSGKKKLLQHSSVLSVIKRDSQIFRKAILEESASHENTPAGNGSSRKAEFSKQQDD